MIIEQGISNAHYNYQFSWFNVSVLIYYVQMYDRQGKSKGTCPHLHPTFPNGSFLMRNVPILKSKNRFFLILLTDN